MPNLGACGLALAQSIAWDFMPHGPLDGMALLEGFELRVQAYEGGSVAILPIGD
jgi:hypothetical protein